MIWQKIRTASARAWFNGPFGIRCVIKNVGGCIFRQQRLGDDLLSELSSYKICGDWFLYSRLAHGGQIAFDPDARAYFRIHGANSSVASFQTERFYEEHIRIARALRRHYDVCPATIRSMLQNVYHQFRKHLGKKRARDFARRNPLSGILAENRSVNHYLFAIPAFDKEGSYSSVLSFANEISGRGDDVSLLLGTSKAGDEIRCQNISREIPIFTREFVERLGAKTFIERFGVDLINTHHSEVDEWLHRVYRDPNVPHVVTDHGSRSSISKEQGLEAWLQKNRLLDRE